MPTILQLPVGVTPTGSELLPVLQNGSTVRLSLSQIAALGGGTQGSILPSSIGQGGATQNQALVWQSGTGWTPTDLTAGTVYTFTGGLSASAGTVTVSFGGSGTASTVAHSDHTHAYAAQSSNLADLTDKPAARSNLGLGPIATLAGGTRGDVVYYGASGWARLAAGTAGQVLQTGGAGADPSWVNAPTGNGGGIALGTPQIITTGGAANADLSKNYIIVDTASAVTLTVGSGTSDGQPLQFEVRKGGGGHLINITLSDGADSFGPLNTPEGPAYYLFRWSASASYWVLSSIADLGVAMKDYAALTSLADNYLISVNDLTGLQDKQTTLATLKSYIGVSAGGGTDLSSYSAITTTGGSTTLSSGQYGAATLLVSGTLTSNATLVVPDHGTWHVKNSCSGNYTLTVKTAAGNGVLIPPFGAVTGVLADGTNCVVSSLPQCSRPAASAFTTWVNQTTATLTDIPGGALALNSGTPAASCSVRGIVQSAPTAPYTVTLTGEYTGPASGYRDIGLLLRNSGTGVLAAVSVSYGGASPVDHEYLAVTHYPSATGTPSQATVFAAKAGPRLRMRIVNDGTNIAYLVSPSGYAWLQVFQEAVSAAGSPDQVGFFQNAFDTLSGTGGNAGLLSVRGWEVLNIAAPQAVSTLAGL